MSRETVIPMDPHLEGDVRRLPDTFDHVVLTGDPETDADARAALELLVSAAKLAGYRWVSLDLQMVAASLGRPSHFLAVQAWWRLNGENEPAVRCMRALEAAGLVAPITSNAIATPTQALANLLLNR